MSGLADINPPSGGVDINHHFCDVTIRGGATVEGGIYPFALLQSSVITADGETISADPGTVGYLFANASSSVASSDLRAGRFCVALGVYADQSKGRVCVRGIVKALIHHSASSNIAIGAPLTATNALNALNALTASGGATPRKFLGVALEAHASSPGTPALKYVDFNGWEGIGGAGGV